MQSSSDIKKALKEMRRAKKEFCCSTFSKEDLIDVGGLTEQEISQIQSVTRFGVTRYERFTVWEYLSYGKKFDLK